MSNLIVRLNDGVSKEEAVEEYAHALSALIAAFIAQDREAAARVILSLGDYKGKVLDMLDQCCIKSVVDMIKDDLKKIKEEKSA